MLKVRGEVGDEWERKSGKDGLGPKIEPSSSSSESEEQAGAKSEQSQLCAS